MIPPQEIIIESTKLILWVKLLIDLLLQIG